MAIGRPAKPGETANKLAKAITATNAHAARIKSRPPRPDADKPKS
jgi:hypothetical protein